LALLDRVSALVRANIDELVDKTDNPEKLLQQLLLDMQNQFIQVKTKLVLAQQMEGEFEQVQTLRDAMRQLEDKMKETKAKSESLTQAAPEKCFAEFERADQVHRLLAELRAKLANRHRE
jgi:phage shock protein A